MGIDGRMQMKIHYGAHAKNDNEREQNRKQILDIIINKAKVNADVYCTTMENAPAPFNHVIIIDVNNNRNFMFQFKYLLKMVIPEFWKLSKKEVEEKRLEMLNDDDCVIKALKQFAVMTKSHITICETYDDIAEGDYKYGICLHSDGEIKVMNTGLMVPNHVLLLKQSIQHIKCFVSALIWNGEKDVKINKDGYWGLFK